MILLKKCVFLLTFIFAVCLGSFWTSASSGELKASYLSNENVNLSLENGYLVISELPENEVFDNMTAVFYKGSGYKADKASKNIETNTVKFQIPYYSNGEYEVSVFCGTDILTPFLPYTVTISINNGSYSFVESPTYSSNLNKFNSSPNNKNDMDFYSFYYLSTDEGAEEVRNIVKSLTGGLNSDYEKAYAIFNWLAENFYYNIDIKSEDDFSNSSPKTLLIEKICDSKDFASLFSFLLRAVGIPARSVYGIGLINNRDVLKPTIHHYWNEIYIDGRWLFVDVAMSCSNQYLDGVKVRNPKTNSIYFDSTLEFFSFSHSIVSYEKPIYYEGYDKVHIAEKPNGTKKTIDALDLPKVITVNSNIGSYILPVEWDLASSEYDPNIKVEQSFKVEGYVTLPGIFAACNSLKQKVVVDITVKARYPISAEISSLAKKLAFFEGSKIDTDGLELKVTFDNGDIETIKKQYDIEYDFSDVGESTVYVSYKNIKVSYKVNVVSRKPLELVVKNEPNKKVYFVDSKFETDGIVLLAKCEYDLSYDIIDYKVEYDFSEAGMKEVLLTYDGLSVIINVTVENVKPIKIVLVTEAENKIFYKDSSPIFSGVTAEVTFNDNSKKTVSNELSYSYDVSKVGKSVVTVYYGDVSTTFEIDVIENILDSSREESNMLDDFSGSHESSDSIFEVSNGNENGKSYVIEIVGISIVSVLLIVLSTFAIMRSKDMRRIHDWLKLKK